MRAVRDLAVGGASAAGAWVCGSWTADLAHRGSHTVDDLVALVASGVVVALCAWYALTAGLLLLARLAGTGPRWQATSARLTRAAGAWGAPLLRRAAVAGLGAGLSLGLSPAWATDQPTPVEHAAELSTDLRPGFVTAARTETLAPTSAPSVETYVVRPGDSLWSISARTLGPDACDAQIAAEWPRWYHANRTVIGAEPDLIHPGQELVAPGPKDSP